MTTCSFDGCGNVYYAHGLCNGHYQQKRRGRELGPLVPKVRGGIEAQIEAYTERTDGCWVWIGALDRAGYGTVNVSGRTAGAHRASFEFHHGPIPAGLVLDHLCRNRACINPAHLEPVTIAENVRRGLKTYAIRTICKRGHDITDPENLKTRKNGSHECRKCARASFQKWQQTKKESMK